MLSVFTNDADQPRDGGAVGMAGRVLKRVHFVREREFSALFEAVGKDDVFHDARFDRVGTAALQEVSGLGAARYALLLSPEPLVHWLVGG